MLLDVLKSGYSLIADYSTEIIDVFDRDTLTCIYASPANYRILGYKPEELIGRHFLELVHPEDLELLQDFLKEKLNLEEGAVEVRTRKKDSTYIWLELQGNIIKQEGQPDYFLAISRDIHECKLAEQTVRENESRLIEQYKFLNSVFDNMNEFCYTYDENYNITFVNQKIIEGTGYNREEMIGQCIFDFVHPDDQERVRFFAEQRLQGKEIDRYEYRFLCKNEQELLVHIKGAPLFNNGKIIGAVLVGDDITEYKKLQSEMIRLDQMHTLGEIAAGIAHEIRNPMTTVNGFLQLLLKDKDFNNKREYLEIMIEELNRANGIIDEFLNLARDKVADLKPCQINQIIRSLAPLLQADAFLSDRTITLKLGDVPDLLLDVKEIRQLIINLVRNALEATPHGGMVEIATWQENDVVLLSIKDQGEGIPDNIKEKLGTPFFSTKDDGTGLGLAICYKIIERHKAKLDIDTSSSGTTFIVKFNCQSHDYL